MENSNSIPTRRLAAGFTLPAVLVVMGALLILAIGALMVVGIERSTARSFVDRNRADLAIQAGLVDIRELFNAETSNDDFLVVESPRKDPTLSADTLPQPAPYLFIARGEVSGGNLNYRQVPLFSNIVKAPLRSPTLQEQAVDDKVIGPNNQTKSLKTLPYLGDAKVAWLPVLDSKGKMISRYAFWVEDLQGKLEAKSAGNLKEGGVTHKRFGWTEKDTTASARFPAPGINPDPSIIGADGRDQNPPLDSIATYLLTPKSPAKEDPALPDAFNKDLIGGRNALVSPNSVLAAAKMAPPLARNKVGFLNNPKARVLEENFVSSVMPYEEQPLVPFSPSIAISEVGKPKLNLNALLAKDRPAAVDEMAAWIDKALPNFEKRKGAFPDDYLKTLAAGALDYADEDSEGTVSPSIMGSNSYRGLDGYPLMSEIILHVKFEGVGTQKGQRVLRWKFFVFVELWNHTNSKVKGNIQFSYENKGIISGIGNGPNIQFDDPNLLNDRNQVKPLLTFVDKRFWFPPQGVELEPNEYRFYKTAPVEYSIIVDLKKDDKSTPFNVTEGLGASGMSMKWNNVELDRSDKLVRQGSSPTKYTIDKPNESGKANIPGHSYGPYNEIPDYRNNMGDSRQALYFRDQLFPTGDNAYPGNVSPNRRNVRNWSIYRNGSGWDRVFGRVIPSEWPDGGHNVPVDPKILPRPLPAPPPPAAGFDPTVFGRFLDSTEGQAPTFLSNRGRFFSVTEFGRIYDPIMYQPTYKETTETEAILKGFMPKSQTSWPSVELGSVASVFYGGGNTLRIGRPEHPLFNQPRGHFPNVMPQNHAARLLDLFQTGKTRSEVSAEREGQTVRIEGHVNINTATVDALRAIAGGRIEMDPRVSSRTEEKHSTSEASSPISPLSVSAPTRLKEADIVAEAIIRGRPYNSPSELASALDDAKREVFGNKELLPDKDKINWSDAAAEELFARVFNSSTVRSRNFRVWIVGQAVAPTEVATTNPEVLSEVRRAYSVFADPGLRKADGTIDLTQTKLTILNENDF